MHGVQGGACILVRAETSAEDVGGMHAAEGILTQARGSPPLSALQCCSAALPHCSVFC
jgi:pyruvate,orthophosphate dikinase